MEKQKSYIEFLQKSLTDAKELLALYEKRQELLLVEIEEFNLRFKENPDNDYLRIHAYENNEHKILLLNETKREIITRKKAIAIQEDYFKTYAEIFDKEWAECEKDFNKVIAIAQSKLPHNVGIREVWGKVNWEHLKQTDNPYQKQAKLEVYKRFKKLI